MWQRLAGGLVPYPSICEPIVNAGAVNAELLKNICAALSQLQLNWTELGKRPR